MTPGQVIEIGSEDSLYVCIDALHLYTLNAENKATNSAGTLKKVRSG